MIEVHEHQSNPQNRFKDIVDKLRKQRVPPAKTKDGREYYLVQMTIEGKHVCSYRIHPTTGEII